MNKEFYIKQNTDLPLLVFKVINNVYNETYLTSIMENIDKVTFTMVSECGCDKVIFNKEAQIMQIEKDCVDCVEKKKEYFIYFKFNKKHTKNKGKYFGQFTLHLNGDDEHNSGIYGLPLKESLVIYIT